jgi:hypothetical protein
MQSFHRRKGTRSKGRKGGPVGSALYSRALTLKGFRISADPIQIQYMLAPAEISELCHDSQINLREEALLTQVLRDSKRERIVYTNWPHCRIARYTTLTISKHGRLFELSIGSRMNETSLVRPT